MDSSDEDEQMFVSLLEEENAAAAEDEDHMMILASLATLYAERNSKPRRVGSAPGHRKAKARQRLEAMFRRRFGMSRDLFLKIVYAVRDLDPLLSMQTGQHQHDWVFLAT
jgi:hypothetical protein